MFVCLSAYVFFNLCFVELHTDVYHLNVPNLCIKALPVVDLEGEPYHPALDLKTLDPGNMGTVTFA
jgi:hypothetical protein